MQEIEFRIFHRLDFRYQFTRTNIISNCYKNQFLAFHFSRIPELFFIFRLKKGKPVTSSGKNSAEKKRAEKLLQLLYI